MSCSYALLSTVLCTLVVYKSKWAVTLKSSIRLGCLEQRQVIYIANDIYQLPVAHAFLMDNQPAKHSEHLVAPFVFLTTVILVARIENLITVKST